MKINLKKFITLGVCFATALLVACDPEGEQNFDFEPGTELIISGAATINTLTPTNYYVQGFTIENDYSWSLDGPDGDLEVLYSGSATEGEYVRVTANAPGTYTLTVSKNGNVTGTRTITANSVTQELSFVEVSSTATEDAGVIEVPVMISGRNLEGTSVSFSVSGDGLTEGVDYVVLTESPLVFGEAENEDGTTYMEMEKNIEIEWMNNLDRNTDPIMLTITLDEIVSTGAGEAAVSLAEEGTEHVVTIEDDLKYIAFTGNEEEENLVLTSAEAEAGVYEFPVGLSLSAQAPVTVNYTVVGVGVTDLTGGSITLRSANDPQPITIEILEAAFEVDQEIRIEITGVTSDDEEVMLTTDEEGEVINNVRTITIQ